jgi:hypothetical protein
VSLPCLSFTDDACPSTFCPSSLFNSARFQLPVKELGFTAFNYFTIGSDLLSFFFLLQIYTNQFICTNFTMGVLEQLNRKSGVIVGDDVLRLFEYAKQKGFAIPAIVSP